MTDADQQPVLSPARGGLFVILLLLTLFWATVILEAMRLF